TSDRFVCRRGGLVGQGDRVPDRRREEHCFASKAAAAARLERGPSIQEMQKVWSGNHRRWLRSFRLYPLSRLARSERALRHFHLFAESASATPCHSDLAASDRE